MPKQSETKHTPTPWDVDVDGSEADAEDARVLDSRSREVFYIEWPSQQELADLRFAVHAVNCHDDLVKCAEILAALESNDGGRSFPTKQDCQFARMTLARATPQS